MIGMAHFHIAEMPALWKCRQATSVLSAQICFFGTESGKKPPAFFSRTLANQNGKGVHSNCQADLPDSRGRTALHVAARKGLSDRFSVGRGLCVCVILGPPTVVPFYLFFGEGSPSKIDYRKGTLIVTFYWRT